MNNEMTTLGDVLLTADSLNWSDALYLPPATPWTLATPAIVHDPSDDESDEIPAAASRAGFEYVLTMQAVQDVVLNVHAQRPSAGPSDVLAALSFYYSHDAFIVL